MKSSEQNKTERKLVAGQREWEQLNGFSFGTMFWNETEMGVAQHCEGIKWFILCYMNFTSIFFKKGSKNTPLYFLFTKRKSHHLWTSNLGDGVEIHRLKEDNNTDRRRPGTFSSLDLRTGENGN